MSAAWSKNITFPKDMRSKGTMLVNGLPCPTHHIVDEEQGFFVCMGEPFWSRVLELLSSTTNVLITLARTMEDQYVLRPSSRSLVLEFSRQVTE